MGIIEIITLPFMQRALIVGVVLAVLLASLGIFVTLRKMSFFGDGIAHASLAGIAIAILTGFAPLPVAILWAIFIALVIFRLERSTSLSSDTLIGILFTASMSLGIILMSFTGGYQPELISFLFGSILAIKNFDLILIVVLSAILLIWLAWSFRDLVYMSLNEESADVAGVPTERKTLFLYIALAIATVLGVKILGIILVSALLILPPATGRLISSSFRSFYWITVSIAEITVLSGLVLSYYLDFPSGATIVLTGTLIFFLALVLRKK